MIREKIQNQFDEGAENLEAGVIFVDPKGIEHKPIAIETCHILMIEIEGTLNTGYAGGQRRIEETVWI